LDLKVHLSVSDLSEKAVLGRTAIIVDVLRASSTICAAFSNGAKDLIPIEDMAAAGRILSNLDDEICVSGGERDGLKFDSFQLGNSPLEYTEEVVSGKTVVLKTTNGTNAIMASRLAETMIIGCFNNASSVANFVQDTDELSIVCAGWRGVASLEDCLFAGYLADELRQIKENVKMDDGAILSMNSYLQNKNRLSESILECDHGQRLIDLGFEEDVTYCSSLDLVDIIPVYKGDRIVTESLVALQAAS